MIVSRNSTRKTFDSLVNNDSFVPSKFHVIMNLKLETHWINEIRYLHSFKLTKKARSMNLDTNFIGNSFYDSPNISTTLRSHSFSTKNM
jgi:hypothetical protein